MNIIAAFYWNGSNDKYISHMIIDDNYQVRSQPAIEKLDNQDFDLFKQKTKNTIDEFFSEIKKICKQNTNCSVKIEHKIVGHAAPAHLYHTQTHKPSDQTEYVRATFFNKFKEVENDSLKLAKQYRKKLTKLALKEFKTGLYDLQLVENKKNNAYQCHLWAIGVCKSVCVNGHSVI